jgi:hypothetical protein
MALALVDQRVRRLEDIFAQQVRYYDQGWVTIGREGETLILPQGTTVRYGHRDEWIEKIVGPEGRIRADNDVFVGGDRIAGVKEIQKSIIPVLVPPIPPAPAAVNVNIPPNVPPPRGGTRRRKRNRKIHRKTLSK